ncbi:MAG: histone deacetylase [Elusimicrobiota bacterium]
MKIITSQKCWRYGTEGHPESPSRVRDTYKYLESLGFGFTEPVECKKQDILRAHTERLYSEVESGDFYDGDTPAYPGILSHCLLSAGAAIMAAEVAVKSPGKETAFSLMRPPGHHAGRDSLGGFCYFNNIAIAVKYLLAHSLTRSIAILDIDCHHGNGTQDIFLSDKKVIFVSLHQSPLYPGTGLKSENNCLNFPLPPGTDEKKYLETLETALGKIIEFKPNVLGVSAGFDTYEKDPITRMGLKKETYKKITKMISQTATPRFAVLEGGYSEDLSECIHNFLSEF